MSRLGVREPSRTVATAPEPPGARVVRTTVIDYGLGNLRSVAGAVERLSHPVRVSSHIEDLEWADKLILPGVGAFGDGMENLRARGLVDALERLVRAEGKPLLGICLGAQLLATESAEFGRHRGLGWLDASVVRIKPADPSLKVPHVGWNEVVHTRPSPLFEGIPQATLYYFVHSFHIQCRDEAAVTSWCEYGGRFVASVQCGRIYGTQFHPEKSQRYGLSTLQNFLERG